MNVRGAFHILKTLVNCMRSRLYKSQDSALAVLLRDPDDVLETREMRNIGGGRHEVKKFLVQLVAVCIEFGERRRISRSRQCLMREHNRFRFDLQMTMLDRKSTRLNSSHANISYAVFCLK